MPELISVLDKDAIARYVADVARRISDDYRDGELIIIGVLKGAFENTKPKEQTSIIIKPDHKK